MSASNKHRISATEAPKGSTAHVLEQENGGKKAPGDGSLEFNWAGTVRVGRYNID